MKQLCDVTQHLLKYIWFIVFEAKEEISAA